MQVVGDALTMRADFSVGFGLIVSHAVGNGHHVTRGWLLNEWPEQFVSFSAFLKKISNSIPSRFRAQLCHKLFAATWVLLIIQNDLIQAVICRSNIVSSDGFVACQLCYLIWRRLFKFTAFNIVAHGITVDRFHRFWVTIFSWKNLKFYPLMDRVHSNLCPSFPNFMRFNLLVMNFWNSGV